MIILDKTEVTGWEAAIRGMRNPMNSWDRSDSIFCKHDDCQQCESSDYCDIDFTDDNFSNFSIGPNDHNLMIKLADGGPVHAKYRRMITVYVDIAAPLYWWKEFDTYKIGTVANSCSTMHKIHEQRFTPDNFSCEHLDRYVVIPKDVIPNLNCSAYDICFIICNVLNYYRKLYLETNDKNYWWQMIQLLPSSYNQKRTVMMNYEVLAGIYKYRRDHKLDEWQVFCGWIKELPYSEIITGIREDKKNG